MRVCVYMYVCACVCVAWPREGAAGVSERVRLGAGDPLAAGSFACARARAGAASVCVHACVRECDVFARKCVRLYVGVSG